MHMLAVAVLATAGCTAAYPLGDGVARRIGHRVTRHTVELAEEHFAPGAVVNHIRIAQALVTRDDRRSVAGRLALLRAGRCGPEREGADQRKYA
jgi:hypothetical protein